MDAYVIRTKRNPTEKIKKLETKKKLKQITIEALPRVVVVEELARLTCILSKENQNTETIVQALEQLKDVRPSKDLLLSTKIGHKINALRQHKNDTVRTLARLIIKDWRRFYKDQRQRQTIDVRSDERSELLRMKARKLLADSIQKNVTDELPEHIERNVYQLCGRKPDISYKRRVRKLCLALKHNIDVREKVCSGQLSVEDLCNTKCP